MSPNASIGDFPDPHAELVLGHFLTQTIRGVRGVRGVKGVKGVKGVRGVCRMLRRLTQVNYWCRLICKGEDIHRVTVDSDDFTSLSIRICDIIKTLKTFSTSQTFKFPLQKVMETSCLSPFRKELGADRSLSNLSLVRAFHVTHEGLRGQSPPVLVSVPR